MRPQYPPFHSTIQQLFSMFWKLGFAFFRSRTKTGYSLNVPEMNFIEMQYCASLYFLTKNYNL